MFTAIGSIFALITRLCGAGEKGLEIIENYAEVGRIYSEIHVGEAEAEKAERLKQDRTTKALEAA